MSALLAMLTDSEGIRLEPSALAGMYGAVALNKMSGEVSRGIHLVWATGGSMVPEDELLKYYREGKEKEKIF